MDEEEEDLLRLLEESIDSDDGYDEADARKTKSDITKDPIGEHDSLKYRLLGPSLTKAGQDSVDQQKVSIEESYDIVD